MLPDPNLGLVIDSKYRIDARLGAGGQGLVYRATHVHLRRPVAFKIIRGDFVGDPDMTERFKREAQMLALMKHPSIVTVLDFGIAKLTNRSGLTNDTASLTGKLAGTPAYMSPEQCAGSPPDARSDVYSLGCVLYEMLTGRPPFVAPALLHLLQMHVDAPPTPPSHYAPHIPPELDVAVLRALAKSRHDRYQTPVELMDALATVPAPSTWPGGSGSLPYDPPPGTPGGVNTLTPSHDSQSDSLPTLGTHVAPARAADEE
jgi:serine/threonine protein kinase